MEQLTKQEFDFCKRIMLQINKMSTPTEESRQNIITLISDECNKKKYRYNFKKIQDSDKIFYIFTLNNKDNLLIFDKFNQEKPIILPSGVANLEFN